MSVLTERLQSGILNIAHRGARSLAPENTLSAARKALEVGADMWELDVGMSADGQLVVVHDPTLERTSNVREVFPSRYPWRACDFTMDELSRLDFGSWFNRSDPFGRIKAGSVSPADMQSYRGEAVLSLDRALRFTLENDWLVNIEIKDLSGTCGHETIVERVVSLVKSLDMAGRVLVSSFNHEYLKVARALDTQIALGALVDKAKRQPAPLLEELHAFSYNPRLSAIKLRDIACLRDRGFHVFVWVANDEAAMQDLIRSGVSGIFTDFPQILSKVLNP